MSASRCVRAIARLSTRRNGLLAARPSFVGLHYFSRSVSAGPCTVLWKPGYDCVSLAWCAPIRPYSGGSSTTVEEVEERILNVLKCFDKVEPDKVSMEAHFMKDLGLDSLDVVEIVMAFEEEFAVDITDEEAEKIFCCKDAFELVKQKMDLS